MINIMGKKNLFLTLIAALLLFHFPAVAQKKPFTGKVTYKIDLNMAGLPEEVKGMMPKSMAMYIGESKVKTEIITAMSNQSTILDLNEKSHTTLFDVMGQKLAVKESYEELTDQWLEDDYSIKITDDSKVIAGYKCKKVILKETYADGEQKEVGFAWFTDELKLHENFNFNNPNYKNLHGLLMEYEMDAGNNMNMKFTAIEVSSMKIKDSAFTPPEGYETITREELSKKFGSW